MAWKVKKPNGKWLVRWRNAEGITESRIMPNEKAADELVGLQSIEESFRPRKSRTSYKGTSAGFVKARTPRVPTFEEYVEQYMAAKSADVRAATRRRDQSAFENWVKGTALGRAVLSEIDKRDVRAHWDGVERNRANVHSLLSGTWNWLEGEGLIFGANPWKAAKIRRPRSEPKDDVLTVGQIEAIADAAGKRSSRDRLMILVMAYGGLRAGEVGGVRKQDVTFEGDRVRILVRGQVTHDARGLAPTKSKAGRRPKVLNGKLAKELRAYMAEVPPARDGRIFHGTDPEKFLYAVRVYQIAREAAEDAGVEGVHPHLFRHTFASMLADDGYGVKAIQDALGDSTPTMAMHYVHTFGHEQDAIADSMTARREKK